MAAPAFPTAAANPRKCPRIGVGNDSDETRKLQSPGPTERKHWKIANRTTKRGKTFDNGYLRDDQRRSRWDFLLRLPGTANNEAKYNDHAPSQDIRLLATYSIHHKCSDDSAGNGKSINECTPANTLNHRWIFLESGYKHGCEKVEWIDDEVI